MDSVKIKLTLLIDLYGVLFKWSNVGKQLKRCKIIFSLYRGRTLQLVFEIQTFVLSLNGSNKAS